MVTQSFSVQLVDQFGGEKGGEEETGSKSQVSTDGTFL